MRKMKTYLEMFPVAHATEVRAMTHTEMFMKIREEWCATRAANRKELEIERMYAEAELVDEDFTETAIAA